MFHRLFIAHPRTVDETYAEHFAFAGRFGLTMIWGGVCALVHAAVPGWCVTTGSNTVARLNQLMFDQRRAQGQPISYGPVLDWVI